MSLHRRRNVGAEGALAPLNLEALGQAPSSIIIGFAIGALCYVIDRDVIIGRRGVARQGCLQHVQYGEENPWCFKD